MPVLVVLVLKRVLAVPGEELLAAGVGGEQRRGARLRAEGLRVTLEVGREL